MDEKELRRIISETMAEQRKNRDPLGSTARANSRPAGPTKDKAEWDSMFNQGPKAPMIPNSIAPASGVVVKTPSDPAAAADLSARAKDAMQSGGSTTAFTPYGNASVSYAKPAAPLPDEPAMKAAVAGTAPAAFGVASTPAPIGDWDALLTKELSRMTGALDKDVSVAQGNAMWDKQVADAKATPPPFAGYSEPAGFPQYAGVREAMTKAPAAGRSGSSPTLLEKVETGVNPLRPFEGAPYYNTTGTLDAFTKGNLTSATAHARGTAASALRSGAGWLADMVKGSAGAAPLKNFAEGGDPNYERRKRALRLLTAK